MRTQIVLVILSALAVLGMRPLYGHAETVAELHDQANKALQKGQFAEALTLAGKAIQQEPKNPETYRFRASIYEGLERYKDALADYDKLLELKPDADLFDRRGSLHFKLGHINESIADFDKYLQLKPEEKPRHWKRGISYYYAGRYEDGRKQFEGYQKVDTNDVENAVWHYLCVARSAGVAKAREAMLKIGKDRRSPMMEIYALYGGKTTPDEVLKAAQGKGIDEGVNQRLFYAHLYLGLYYEVEGDKKKALEHMSRAVECRIGHYMWEVARVHQEMLKKDNKPR